MHTQLLILYRGIKTSKVLKMTLAFLSRVLFVVVVFVFFFPKIQRSDEPLSPVSAVLGWKSVFV